MKIKIKEPGLSYFTGVMSGVAFKDGISVSEVSQRQVDAIGASMRCVAINEDESEGDSVGAATRLHSFKSTGATAVVETKEDREAATAEKDAATPAVAAAETPAPDAKYTQADLEKVADEDGIAGLRKVADEFNVKGRSIKELISEILAAQGSK